MNQVRIQSVALADANKATKWYETQRSGLGIEFVLELDAAIARAAESPEAYSIQYRGARRVLLRCFPYAVYFIHADRCIEVFAVLHQQRESSSWQSRISE